MTARKHSPEPIGPATAKKSTARGTLSRQPILASIATRSSVGGTLSGDAQASPDSQMSCGVTGPSPEPTRLATAKVTSAQGPPSVPPNPGAEATEVSAAPDFTDLRIWAESFADAQQTRIALVNRMERGGIDADLLAGHRELLDASENAFRLAMVRSYRRVVRQHMPAVEEWQKASFGIGEHLLARLLGHLGHPVIAEPYQWMDDAPDGHACIPERCGERHLVALEPFERSLRQLWAYCGVGSPERRRKGMSQQDALALGKPQLKMLVRLLAEASIKCRPQPILSSEANSEAVGGEQSTPPTSLAEASRSSAGSGPSPNGGATARTAPVRDRFFYRRVYDARKESTANRMDADGKPWTDGHRHADALRIVSKEILRDLWTAAQTPCDSQIVSGTVGGPS